MAEMAQTLKSLTIIAPMRPSFLEHLRCRAPLLEELDIKVICNLGRDDAFFNGD